MRAVLLSGIFRRYDLPNAEELANGSLAEVAAQIRGSLKSRAKILKTELGITHAKALELLARLEGFEHWHELTRALSTMEDEPGQHPSPQLAQRLLAFLVQWPAPAPEQGDQNPAERIARRELMSHVIITHAHGHKLAKLLQLPLGRTLDLAAKLHGAPDWNQCVYGVEHWVEMAKA